MQCAMCLHYFGKLVASHADNQQCFRKTFCFEQMCFFSILHVFGKVTDAIEYLSDALKFRWSAGYASVSGT